MIMNSNSQFIQIAVLSTFTVAAPLLIAGSRSSAIYSITTDVTDNGGQTVGSASYSNIGSAGRISGISAVESPSEILKAGYLGQLYEVVGLSVTSASPTVNESATLQLAAWRLLDDATLLPAIPTEVTWGILSGPIAEISPVGLLSAGVVYQDTGASVAASVGGLGCTLGFQVINVQTDDFGSYAGDGIGDAWQVEYFGLPPNGFAGPYMDPDGDGQNNLFEFTAGVVPTNPASLFRFRIEGVPDEPERKRLIFSPRLSDRNYTVIASTDLSFGNFVPLANSLFIDDNDQRTVTDLDAVEFTKFYRVEITKP